MHSTIHQHKSSPHFGILSSQVLQDLLIRYIRKLGVDLHAKAELGNRSEPNIVDLQYVFKTNGIDFNELVMHAEMTIYFAF